MNQIQARIEEWQKPPYDEKTRQEILALRKKDPQALEDAFCCNLSFGTGGLRGLMGPGTNRINIYTIRKTTQGLANYIHKVGNPQKGVLIGFDSRHHSTLFAQETARVLAANNIPVFLLSDIRPTPFISFSCRYKKCQAAVMITASHNPKEYNGYKVYWQDGAQVVPPHDAGILEEVDKIDSIVKVKYSTHLSPLIIHLNEELDTPYLLELSKLQHFPKENKKEGASLKISYTSLHGTGITLMPKALSLWGFTNYNFVESQIIADGEFPTVKFPNPEYLETLSLGIKQLQTSASDLLIATDPDADRLAVVVMHEGKPIVLNGNEMASICIYFLCHTLPSSPANKGAFVTTIVTTELLKTIAQAYNYPCFETLTGFKYIGEKIHQWEQEKNGYHFIFGAEESYGFLLGTYARDKDGIIAGCFLSEIALYLKKEKRTLIDFLKEIYTKFGVFREKQKSLDFQPGEEGLKMIHTLMEKLRKDPPSSLNNKKVVSFEDLKKKTPAHLPSSDVLILRVEDESKVVIRPSGTEPKIKVYVATTEKNFSSVEQAIKNCDERLDQLLATIPLKP